MQVKTRVSHPSPFIVGAYSAQGRRLFHSVLQGSMCLPKPGLLIDRRGSWSWIQFEIQVKIRLFVWGKRLELTNKSRGITFTSKEWDMAQKEEDYSGYCWEVHSHPYVQIIGSPSLLHAKKNVFTTVQVRWNIYESEVPKTLIVRDWGSPTPLKWTNRLAPIVCV